MTKLDAIKYRTCEKIRLTLIMMGADESIADKFTDILDAAMDTGHAIGYTEGYRDACEYARQLARDIPLD